MVARRPPAVGNGKRTAAAGRGRKSRVKVAVENTPELEPLELDPQTAVSTTGSCAVTGHQEFTVSVSSLELGASVECSTSADGPGECSQPTIKLGKYCLCCADQLLIGCVLAV